MKNSLHIYLLIVYFLISFQHKVISQTLVAGTQFTPKNITAGKTYYGINDISQYGMIGGAITVTPPLTPNTNANTFNNTAYYAITTNPDTLDNIRYDNLPTATNYMLVFSPPNFVSGSTLLTYTVNGLAAGSNVSVIVSYCNVESANNTTCIGQAYPLKGVINANQYNLTNGVNTGQVGPTQSGTYTWTQSSGSSQVVQAGGQAVFNLNVTQEGACEAMAITKIEIYSTPAPAISSSAGTNVCTGDQTTLQLSQAYDSATYQWQQSTNGGTTWTNISGATGSSYLLTAAASGTAYQYQALVTYDAKTFASNIITISSVACCPSGFSSQTVYYNDFGTFDLINDPTAKTYYIWDYKNYNNPVQVKYTTTTPFEYELSPPPPGTSIALLSPVGNDEYVVAAGLNGYSPYTYPSNGVTYPASPLGWSANIGGFSAQPAVAFDHSGAYNGAALLINLPSYSKGNVIYSDTINNLCGDITLFFEVYLNVFTSSSTGGVFYPVNVQLKLIDPASGVTYTNVDSTTAAAQVFPGTTTYGCGCWVRLTGQLTLSPSSTSMIFQLIQNQNDNANGDDLVIDDIKVMSCTPPGASACVTTITQVVSAATTTQQVLFPNPSTGMVSIASGQFTTADISVISSTGKIVYTQNAVNLSSATLDLSSLPQGLYFVQISSGESVVTQKLALE